MPAPTPLIVVVTLVACSAMAIGCSGDSADATAYCEAFYTANEPAIIEQFTDDTPDDITTQAAESYDAFIALEPPSAIADEHRELADSDAVSYATVPRDASLTIAKWVRAECATPVDDYEWCTMMADTETLSERAFNGPQAHTVDSVAPYAASTVALLRVAFPDPISDDLLYIAENRSPYNRADLTYDEITAEIDDWESAIASINSFMSDTCDAELTP